ncbi:hypothetical protein JTE90_023855 [Oedothorax gibbosus]|uniref:Uncharacterized protein n=1 Tax=Oedothorax gibbosus TaxID=931172 RepID=A0AAV6TLZ3_9ARAC|nr:hypothetical protein JTE90_023855 [Oedothorax gibbosus]
MRILIILTFSGNITHIFNLETNSMYSFLCIYEQNNFKMKKQDVWNLSNIVLHPLHSILNRRISSIDDLCCILFSKILLWLAGHPGNHLKTFIANRVFQSSAVDRGLSVETCALGSNPLISFSRVLGPEDLHTRSCGGMDHDSVDRKIRQMCHPGNRNEGFQILV